MTFPPGNLVNLVREPHDADFVRHIVEGVLKALTSYHERGRSYGQVRPDTVFLAADGRVRLGDVRATIVSTQVEAPEGLAKYLPPETLAADVFGEVGPATDIYALGLLALELLVGPKFEHLFDGIAEDPLGGDLAWMRWHGTAELRLPPVKQIVPSVSADFAAVIDRMIAKRVAERPATAQQVLSMLSGHATARVAEAPPQTGAAPANAPSAPVASPPAVEAPSDVGAASAVAPELAANASPTNKTSDEQSVRQTQQAAAAATIYYDDSETVDGATHGIDPLPDWQNDVRATPRVTDTAKEEPDESTAEIDSPVAPVRESAVGAKVVEDAPPSPQPIRGTMMPDENDSVYGRTAAAPTLATPIREAPKNAPEPASPRRASDAHSGQSHPADHMPPAMKLAMKRRRGPLDHPAVLVLMSGAIIAAVAYLLFVVWPVDDGTREVLVTSEPPGASVSINGVASNERTPAKLKLKIGKHDVRAVLADYYEAKQSIEIAEDDGKRTVSIELTKIPTVRQVRLETQPADAEVYVDDGSMPLGSRTPVETVLTLGAHKVRFKKAGFSDTDAAVDVKLGEGPQLQTIPLSPLPKQIENVIVKLDPPNATLASAGKAIPVDSKGEARVPVEEGASLELTAKADGFADFARTTSFDDLKAAGFSVVAELEPYISFVPPDTAVKVNDVPLPLENGRAVLASKVKQPYRIVATAKDYAALDVTLTRTELADRGFRVELAPGPRPSATLRQVAEGRYVHDALDKAGAPLYFVVIEPGPFEFGVPQNSDVRSGELPLRKAEINEPYLISTTEISVKQYEIFAAKVGDDQAGTKWRHKDSDAPNLPVTNVSHQQAKNFAAFVDGTLPTEKQWERAARGTKARIYPWTDGGEPTRELCNLGFDAPKVGKLVAVDALPAGATPEGVLNMLGNAAEWCEDKYEAGHRDIEDKIDGLREFPTIRGGSYKEPYNKTSPNARATMRAPLDPRGAEDVGFRVVVPFTTGK